MSMNRSRAGGGGVESIVGNEGIMSFNTKLSM